MILVLAAQKGGTGKSAIAQNLAVYLQQHGHKVKLVDGDKQGTTVEWIEERREAGRYPDIRFSISPGKCRDDLLADEDDGYTVVVDCGGHDSVMMREAMTAATHILIPVRPKRRDIKTLMTMSEIVEQCKVVNPGAVVRAVINQCPTLPSLGKRVANAKAACTAFGIEPLESLINSREVFDDADEDGATVFEFEPRDEKAVAEITNVAIEMLGVK
jgi:chromosome partitioning protein